MGWIISFKDDKCYSLQNIYGVKKSGQATVWYTLYPKTWNETVAKYQ